MLKPFRCFFALLLLSLPVTSIAHFNLIQLVPDQSDDEWGINGQSVVEAPNGDVLVIYGKNGEITDSSSFPFKGAPATLVLQRKTKGLFWETPVILDTAIENGVQGVGQPHAALLPDGRIMLTYFYHEALAPNFSVSNKVWVSSDSGTTWQPLSNRDRESAGLSVTAQGTVVSLDWVDDGLGNLSFHTSVYEAETDTWLPNGLISDAYFTENDPICTQTLHSENETEWHFYFTDCVFGYGGTNRVLRKVTTDGGANWGEVEELFTADSGFGGTLGSIVAAGNGVLMAVYSSGTFMAYRMSSDGGMTWSEAEDWTGNTEEYGDISPKCSASNRGPLCVFLGRRDTVNQLLHIGVAGISEDPLISGASFALNAGFNDAWYNSNTNGQGFLVSVFPGISQMFIAWFTFDTERPDESVQAVLGDAGHRWITAQGPFSGDSGTLTIYVTRGGVFDSSDPAPDVPTAEGTMEVIFLNCTEGLVKYDIPSLGLMGEIPIQRIAPDNVSLCEALSE